jgi:hypothetical protein
VTVNAVNDAPLAVDDVTVTDEETPVTLSVVGNDDDPNDPLGNIDPTSVTTTGVLQAANGTVTVNGDGTVTYTPNADYNGKDIFEYIVCDDGNPLPALCDTAIVTVTVNPVNDPPVAIDDVTVTNEDTPVTLSVISNDDDPNDPLGNIDPSSVTTTGVLQPMNGTVTVNGDGTVTYTPNADFNGEDSFEYIVCDDGTPLPALCDTALVIVTVNPVNDPPVAIDDVTVTDEETPVVINVNSNDTDLDGNIDPSSVTTDGVIQPSNGTVTVNADGTITYTPESGFFGEDTFEYIICDDGTPLPGECDTALVTITVNQVPDITPILRFVPGIASGVTQMAWQVTIQELVGVATEGLITVVIPKDPRLVISYDQNATFSGPYPTPENVNWFYDNSNTSFHIWTSINEIPATGKSRFGFLAEYNPEFSSGEVTYTVTIIAGSGNENNVTNNIDTEILKYFNN